MIAFILAAAAAAPSPDPAYAAIEKRYVDEFLRRHPVVSTYLGGAGLDPQLAKADGQLRDWSPAALDAEAKVWIDVRRQLENIDPAKLTPAQRVDREVILNQTKFMLRYNQDRKVWRRSVDTYVNEAFRGIDWYMQGMSDLGGGRYGSEAEWRRVVERLQAVPAYLKQAQANLAAGLAAGDYPDWRMVERDGLKSAEANARFFEKDLPELAAARTKGQPFAAAVATGVTKAGTAAAAAFRDFRAYLEKNHAKLPKADRFAIGAAEYDWALHNNLRFDTTVEALFAESPAFVDKTRAELMATAQRIAEARKLEGLAWDDASREASTRAVMDALAQEHPKSDDDMIRGYREMGARLVEYGRKNDLFDIPADYKLDVTVVPPVLESSIDSAAYYPAPTFKDEGVGRFYVAAPRNDVEKLKLHNPSAMAYLAAHEGFPGHDWHYKVMTKYRKLIGPVRWLTPGEVEGSASMWQDSVAAEGWGLYAEHLMSEAVPGGPQGFYTPEERLYQLRGQLLRDLRVRLDTGLHTGKIGYDEAVDLYSRTIDFRPGSCKDATLTPEKKASCDTADRAIFRYSRWPTQAITYRLGKQEILSLRAKADVVRPGPEGRKRFHVLFMQQGTVPPRYFERELLEELKK